MAQVSNDYTLEAFSGYIDVLINFMVPLLIFLIVDYEYESKIFVRLSRSLVFFINVAIQQELAFIFSPFKVSNFIKSLQHIVISLLGIEIIGNFIIFFSTKGKKTKTNPLENLEKTFEKKFEGEIYNLKKTVKAQSEKIQTLEGRFEREIQYFKRTLEEDLKSQIRTLKQHFNERIRALKDVLKMNIQHFKQFFEKRIQILEKFFEINIKTQIQTLKENTEKNFLLKSIYEPKFETLEKRVENLEQKVDSPNKTPMTIQECLPASNEDLDEMLNAALDAAKSEYDKDKSVLDKTFEEELDNTFKEELDNTIQEELKFQKKLKNIFQNMFQKKFDNILQKMLEIPSEKFKIFIHILRLATKFTALTLFVIIIGFLLNDLKGNITQSFIMSLVISVSLILIIQLTILIMAYRRKKLKVYIENIENQRIYNNIVSKYYAYISIIEEFISINLLYLPSLINYFLLQTPNIFNKIFLNLSALLVTVWVIIMYKSILKNE